GPPQKPSMAPFLSGSGNHAVASSTLGFVQVRIGLREQCLPVQPASPAADANAHGESEPLSYAVPVETLEGKPDAFARMDGCRDVGTGESEREFLSTIA